jgi:choline dehydrogenase-like flavoprotein
VLIDTRELKSPHNYVADICIIGAGVAGIVLANELINSGKSIVVLEAGGRKLNDQIQQFYRAQSFPDSFSDPTESRLRVLGGSCNIWENSTERLDNIDFLNRDWVSDSGWPIGYADIEPYYPAAEHYCGVGRDGYDADQWFGTEGFEDVRAGSNVLVPTLVKSALPPTRFFDKYGEQLTSQSNVQVFSHAALTDMDFDQEQQRVKRITFQANSDTRHSVDAGIVVFCMGGIENARMLLQVNEKYNNVVGNLGDNVGRYFMEHPTIRAAQFYPVNGRALPTAYQGVFDGSRLLRLRVKLNESSQFQQQANNLRFLFSPQSRRILSDGISSTHIVLDDLSEGEWPDNFGLHIANILGDIDLVADSLSRKLLDAPLLDSAEDITGYQVVSMIEQTPERQNRVFLGDEMDAFGNKRIKIQWRLSESDKQQAWKGLELFAQDSGLSKWGRVRLLPERASRIWGDQVGFAGHHMGTTKMGRSMQDGVVDEECRVFGADNLFMAGCSVFPTGGHVPPTLTIAALSIRLAETIKREMASS